MVEYIFVCDEEVMGSHNDRRADGKITANDSGKVNSFNIHIFSFKSH